MIDLIGDFLQRNLTVFLAVALIPLKIAVIRFCKDREGEAAAILSIPEDLSYVAFGLILSDLLNATGALHQRFRFSRHPSLDIAVVVGFQPNDCTLDTLDESARFKGVPEVAWSRRGQSYGAKYASSSAVCCCSCR